MEEKKQKNREKEKLEHDLYQQLQLVDKLKTIDKSTLASIVNSLRHQRNNPQLTVDLDQLQSTLLQEAREQLYRYEQLGLGRKKGQGITLARQPIHHPTSIHSSQQEQYQQQQQQEQQNPNHKPMDDELPFTYETLLPLIITPVLPTLPTVPLVNKMKKKKENRKERNIKSKKTEMHTVMNDKNQTELIDIDVEIDEEIDVETNEAIDVDIDVKEKKVNENVKTMVSEKGSSLSSSSSSLPITSKENTKMTTKSLSSSTSSTIHTATLPSSSSSSLISIPRTKTEIETDYHENDKIIPTSFVNSNSTNSTIDATTLAQLDPPKEKRFTRSRSSSLSSLKSTTSKKSEDKKLRDEKVLTYFKSHGSLVATKGQRRSMRTVYVFGDKIPFFDTTEFSLPLDQFGDLMKKRKRT
ncbi:unnamed protein product [Cunninghamella blakesleeana]